MRKRTVLFFVFDGFADWESAYALVGITKSKAYQIKTIAFNKEPKRSLGGVAINPDLDFLPETDLKDIDLTNTAMLILPGGDVWEERVNTRIAPLVEHCISNRIPVAAICGAAVLLADLGILNKVRHTSNDLRWLESVSLRYRGQHLYECQPAVIAHPILTASGTAPVEFAAAVFEMLNIRRMDAVSGWFQYFESGESGHPANLAATA